MHARYNGTQRRLELASNACIGGTWLQNTRRYEALGSVLGLCGASHPACCWPWPGPLRTDGQESKTHPGTSWTCPMAWPSQRERVELRGLAEPRKHWQFSSPEADRRSPSPPGGQSRAEHRALHLLGRSFPAARRGLSNSFFDTRHTPVSPKKTPTLRLPRPAAPRGARRTCLRSVRSSLCP